MVLATVFPRISITLDADEETKVQGKLNTLALGFGIHQAWIYTALFGVANRLPTVETPGLSATSSYSPIFLISILTFTCTLLFAAITDQRFLEFYTAKRVIVGASLLATIGTLAIMFASTAPPWGTVVSLFAGISTGIGSALLMLFWGTNFSRHGNITIIINTAIAMVIALAIFSLILHVFPYPASCIIAALLPLCELPFLWNLTPVSYAVRHAIPIFTPLPVRKLPFSLRIVLPTFSFGLVIGAMRFAATSTIALSTDPTAQFLALLAGGAVTCILLVTPFCLNMRSHWDGLFRPTIIFIAVALLLLPLVPASASSSESFILLISYLCFESLMWVFLGELSQEFRLSPIFMFGLGQGCLALGSAISPFVISFAISFPPLGDAGKTALAMFAIIVGYATMPHVCDIKRAVTHPDPGRNPTIVMFNERAGITYEGTMTYGTAPLTNAASSYDPQSAALSAKPPCAKNTSMEGEQQVVQPLESPTRNGANTTCCAEAEALAACESDRQAESSPNASDNRVLETQEQPAANPEASQSEPANQAPSSEADIARKSGRFRMQCEAIADTYLLSRRETEVMFLLAKGYNAAYIQDKLYISKSTAKTHIGHIYRKLNIHNQQELLRMVEEAYKG